MKYVFYPPPFIFARLNDYAFWNDEPWFNTTVERCEVISAAMASQVTIVNSAYAAAGLPPPPTVTFLWDEVRVHTFMPTAHSSHGHAHTYSVGSEVFGFV